MRPGIVAGNGDGVFSGRSHSPLK